MSRSSTFIIIFLISPLNFSLFFNSVINFEVIFKTQVCFSISAPNRPPGNVSWKTDGSGVLVRWDHVKAMHNESAVLGYKVSAVWVNVCVSVIFCTQDTYFLLNVAVWLWGPETYFISQLSQLTSMSDGGLTWTLFAAKVGTVLVSLSDRFGYVYFSLSYPQWFRVGGAQRSHISLHQEVLGNIVVKNWWHLQGYLCYQATVNHI